MKFLVLSDSVLTTLIITIGGIITLVLTVFVLPLLNKIFNKQVEIREGQIQSHKEMDGMKDELVRTTAALNDALGNRKGREELLQEQKETGSPEAQIETNRQEIEKLKTSAEPMPVIVTNAEPMPVIVTKNAK